jgi:hypothetical protein
MAAVRLCPCVILPVMEPAVIIKKEIEKRALEAARRASVVIPDGELQEREAPDFILAAAGCNIGIEVRELLPAANSKAFDSPLAERSFRQRVVQLAEREYYKMPGAPPVHVQAFFWNREGIEYDKREMARALVDFVRSKRVDAGKTKLFSWRPHLPAGFGIISITAIDRRWSAPDHSSPTIDQIPQLLATAISDKNTRLPAYRTNLPGVPIWLLIYSCAEVSRSVPLPHGINEWAFPFDFDRVLFFAVFENRVIEIRKG